MSLQNFIRALKAFSDPPEAGGPLKIEIARKVWEDTTYNVPNKAETIAEFILVKLLREKDKKQDNPIADPRYWGLLLDVLCSHSSTITTAQKTWLIPLLNRTPIAPVLISLLNFAATNGIDDGKDVLGSASIVLNALWPLASPKMTAESLVDCFGAFLAAGARSPSCLRAVQEIGKLVSPSARAALINSTNKRKLHNTFTELYLGSWIVTVHYLEGASSEFTDVYSTGRDMLFNADTLKHLTEPSITNPLIKALAASPTSFAALPELFRSFIHAARKHQALFGKGQSLMVEIRTAAMNFLGACEAFIQSAPHELATDALNSRLKLLHVIEDESLLGNVQANSYEVLQNLVKACVSIADVRSVMSPHANKLLRCLHVLARIDYDLVMPLAPVLFAQLLNVPCDLDCVMAPAAELLSQCIEYHSRARSLPILVSEVLTALAALSAPEQPGTDLYIQVADCPLLSRQFLSALSKAVNAFLTPGQVLPLARDFLSTLEGSWNTYTASAEKVIVDGGQGPRKKARRSSKVERSDSMALEMSATSISFSSIAKLAAAILPALPMHLLSDSSRAEATAETGAALQGFLQNAIEQGALTARNGDRRYDLMASQVVCAAALKLTYALLQSTALSLDFDSKPGLYSALLATARCSDVLPELLVDIARLSLTRVNGEIQEYFSDFLDCTLSYIEKHASNAVVWSGRVAQLTLNESGRPQAAVALFKLIIERVLLVIDLHGSQAQLERVAELLCNSLGYSLASRSGPSLSAVTTECLRSAQLWEQHRLRSSLLSSVNKKLSALDNIDLATHCAQKLPLLLEDTSISSEVVSQAIKGFAVLLYTPSEYYSRAMRSDVLRRATLADMALASKANRQAESAELFKLARTLLGRLFLQTGPADHALSEDYIMHLHRYPKLPGDGKISSDIIDTHYLISLKAAERGSSESLAAVLDSFTEPPISTPNSADWEALVARFMLVASENFSPKSFDDVVLRKLDILFQHVTNSLQLFLRQPTAFNRLEEILERSNWLCLYGRLLHFGSWLGRNNLLQPGLAVKLASLLFKSRYEPRPLKDTYEAVFSIHLAELMTVPTHERKGFLEQIIASAVLFSDLVNSTDILDSQMLTMLRNLSPEEFSHCLDFISEALDSAPRGESSGAVVRVGATLLSGAPEGTLKTIQSHFSRWIQVFTDYDSFTTCARTRMQVFTLISRQCSGRPASIRPVNMATIWSLLMQVFNGSDDHDEVSSPQIFLEATSIVGALVRSRRDLVLDTLPHICAILRQLISCLRAPRPNLGSKQYLIVASTLPRWINPRAPLGTNEGQAISRLLSTLTTKSITRGHFDINDSQKAESLSRPLSKHTAYVLQAYIDAISDSLCVVSMGIRRELQPGLFVLCSMLNEHDRNAFMASGLDSSGKAIFKSIWREYEKGRYVGRG